MKTVGFTPIRNGISLGYPFVEAITSVLKVVDEFLVCDYGSEDDTLKILETMAELNNKIIVKTGVWPKHSASGSAISVVTNRMIKQCSGDRLFYVQADEVYHETSENYLSEHLVDYKHKSISVNFLHFRNSFYKIIANPTYNTAIRIFSKKGVKSIKDGYNFGGDVKPIWQSGVHLWHMGWCFPKNICNKHINHASLYPGNGTYEKAKRICKEMLESGNISTERLCNEIDRQYKFNNRKDHPLILSHLLNQQEYNPHKSIEVLERKIRDA